jgi:hypothetical protein
LKQALNKEYPVKPHLSKNVTSEEAFKFANDLKEYEGKLVDYKKEKEEYKTQRNIITSIIVEFIKKESGLYDIPKQYQDKVYYKAYQDGHSDGYYSVYQHLEELVDIFK